MVTLQQVVITQVIHHHLIQNSSIMMTPPVKELERKVTWADLMRMTNMPVGLCLTDQETPMEDHLTVMLLEEAYPENFMTTPIPHGLHPVQLISPEAQGKEVLEEISNPSSMSKGESLIGVIRPSVDPV